jgi:hypothetical protein
MEQYVLIQSLVGKQPIHQSRILLVDSLDSNDLFACYQSHGRRITKCLWTDQGFKLDGPLLSSSYTRSSLILSVSLGGHRQFTSNKFISMRSLDHVTWTLKLDNKHQTHIDNHSQNIIITITITNG